MACDQNGKCNTETMAQLTRVMADLATYLRIMKSPAYAGLATENTWATECGLARGFMYKRPTGGPAGGPCNSVCSPQMPTGLWLLPFQLDVPFGAVPLQVLPNTPSEAYMVALTLDAAFQTVAGTAVNLGDTRVSGWQTQSSSQLYPRWGTEASAGLTAIQPDAVVRPGSLYTQQQLLNGFNFMPPGVAQFDMSAKGRVRFDLGHTNAANVTIIGHVFTWFPELSATQAAAVAAAAAQAALGTAAS